MVIDIVCAHSHLGWSRRTTLGQTRVAGQDAHVRFLPAQLAPNAPTHPTTPAVHEWLFGPSAAESTAQVTRQGQQEGIEFRFDRAQFVNSRDAHLLLALAQTQHKGEEAASALFDVEDASSCHWPSPRHQ